MARDVPKDIGLVELIRNANPAYNRLDIDAGLTTLVEDIHKNGIQVPILIRSDYQIIDGARRFEAALALGWDWVPTRTTDDFYGALTGIANAREHGRQARRMNWLEVDNLIRHTLVPLYDPIRRENLSKAMLKKGLPKARNSNVTSAIADALGAKLNQIEAMRRLGVVVASAARHPELRAHMIDLILERCPSPPEDWGKGIHRTQLICEEMRANWARTGSIQPPPPTFLDAKDQVARLTKISQILEGVNREINEVGQINPEFPLEEIPEIRRVLYATGRAVGGMRTQLRNLTEER